MTILACAPIDESPSIFDAVGSFAATAESAADLGLHRVVDETVDTLLAEAKFFNGMAGTGAVIISRIGEATPITGQYIDPDGALEDTLLEIIDRHESFLARMTAKKATIDRDNRLHESHCDMLHSAYNEELNAVAVFIETAKDMIAAMSCHDLAASPRDGAVYGSVDELRAAMLN